MTTNVAIIWLRKCTIQIRYYSFDHRFMRLFQDFKWLANMQSIKGFLPSRQRNCLWFVRPPSYLHWTKFQPIHIDPEYSYGCRVFLWLPRWSFPTSRLPGIPIDPQIFLWLFLTLFHNHMFAGPMSGTPYISRGTPMIAWVWFPGIPINPLVFL